MCSLGAHSAFVPFGKVFLKYLPMQIKQLFLARWVKAAFVLVGCSMHSSVAMLSSQQVTPRSLWSQFTMVTTTSEHLLGIQALKETLSYFS